MTMSRQEANRRVANALDRKQEERKPRRTYSIPSAPPDAELPKKPERGSERGSAHARRRGRPIWFPPPHGGNRKRAERDHDESSLPPLPAREVEADETDVIAVRVASVRAVAAMRARRTPIVPVTQALADLINRGSFHGQDLHVRCGDRYQAQQAVLRAEVRGWVTRGHYDPTQEQLCCGRTWFEGNGGEDERPATGYHWITATDKWLEPAEVEQVLHEPTTQTTAPVDTTPEEPSELVQRVIELSDRCQALRNRTGPGNAAVLELMRERDELARGFTLADVHAYGAWLRQQPVFLDGKLWVNR